MYTTIQCPVRTQHTLHFSRLSRLDVVRHTMLYLIKSVNFFLLKSANVCQAICGYKVTILRAVSDPNAISWSECSNPPHQT